METKYHLARQVLLADAVIWAYISIVCVLQPRFIPATIVFFIANILILRHLLEFIQKQSRRDA